MSYAGKVKSFNPVKSFGFIEYQGTDVFVHIKDCVGGQPKPGDTVMFDIEESQNKPGSKKAVNVSGGSGALRGVMGNGSCQGTVKSFNPTKGFGFIQYEGSDIFLHINDCEGGCPNQGDTVAFDLEDSLSKPGTKKASHVTGGTGNLEEAKATAKGMGKGVWDAFAPMWSGKGGWGGFDPYGGKGWGMSPDWGWGKGKGKGKW